MLIACQNCGAPLKVDGSKMFVDCQYCGLSNKVASSKTLMHQVPADWQPPAQWTPEMQGQVVKGAAVATAGAAAGGIGLTGCILAFVFVLVLGIGGFVFFTVNRAVDRTTGGSVLPFAETWDGSAPFTCSMNQDVRIEGVTANLPGQTAIRADMNCSVTIVSSNITAAHGIDATGNGVIRLENTTIHTTGPGITVGMNKNLVLVNSNVTAGGVGLEASMNAEITVEGGRIEGSPVAIQPGRHGVQNRGAELVDRP